MQRRRDTNVDRIEAGLKELGKPGICETINQGGNAMQTMTQPPENAPEICYDIDMGVVFEAADAKEPATVKGWISSALAKKATNLKYPPTSKKKCVRLIYADGYQCDFPVFKRTAVGDSYTYQIAIGDQWIDSDPQRINQWFATQIAQKSPPEDDGYQLRRIVRLVKYFAKVHSSRTGLKFPAGLVVTALVVECYQAVEERDDESLFKTLERISVRSEHLPVIANGSVVSGEKDVDRLARLRKAASEAVSALSALNQPGTIANADALKAWNAVFRHSFFEAKHGTLETKSAKWTPAAPAIVSLPEKEVYRRAEAAAREVEQSGPQSKPWSK